MTLSGPLADTQEAEETTFSGIVKWLFEQREANRGLLLLLACEYSCSWEKNGMAPFILSLVFVSLTLKEIRAEGFISGILP